MTTEIEVKLLGPLEVMVPHGGVEFEGAKQRRLFVALALRAPEAVSVDELVEAVWGDDAPDGREQALQKQVSRLRARARRGLAGAPPRRGVRARDRPRGDRQPALRVAARAGALRTRRPVARGRAAGVGARALARAGAGRPSRRGVHAERDQAPGGAAAGGDRGAAGGRAGRGQRRRPGRRAARARGRAPAARAAARAADARALPRRPPGRRAGGHARGPPAAGRRAGARAGAGAAPAGGHDPRPRSRRSAPRTPPRCSRRRCRRRRA